MKPRIFLTSFQTWLPHQKSNSADDLLAEITEQDFSLCSLILLRKLPVDTLAAGKLVIDEIAKQQPDAVICCGMAESRGKLTVESNARCENVKIYTSFDLDKLVAQLSDTEISHDAGNFVCEGLYYQVLNYLQQFSPQIPCIFVHVPIISPENITTMLLDFKLILQQIVQDYLSEVS